MSDREEITAEEFFGPAKPAPVEAVAKEIVSHFSKPDPSDVDLVEPEDLGTLEYNGLDEHLLSDFLAAKGLKEKYEAIEKDLHARIVKALGRDRGDILRGTHVLTAKDVAARKSTDWERFVRDTIGEVKPDDLKPYVKEGKPSLRVEVRKLK